MLSLISRRISLSDGTGASFRFVPDLGQICLKKRVPWRHNKFQIFKAFLCFWPPVFSPRIDSRYPKVFLYFQAISLLLSFLSVLQTLIQFNEWSKRRHTLHRMTLVVPFFAVTILYRALAISLILVFAGGQFGFLPIFGLLLTQVRRKPPLCSLIF